MLTLQDLKAMLDEAGQFVASKNYHYENHACPATGAQEEARMDYCLKDEKSNEIIKFGPCPHCHNIYYHNDYES